MMREEKLDQIEKNIRMNLALVNQRITEAADKAGRDLDEIKLIAVTKLMSVEVINAAIEAGIRRFGENYAEQAAEKIDILGKTADIEWHMIGHIQSRKAETVSRYFDMVHSLDRMKIARYLDKYAKEQNRVTPVLIEVNVSGEASKYGWDASDESLWPNLADQFREICAHQNIEVKGLMTMPPLFDDPEDSRPIYKKLRHLQQFLIKEVSESKWDELSIGTSFDYPIAVEEGATMVRIGTEIFGSRPTI
jgi:pyridoxal phosphate enzyme (YggS family)